MLPEASSPQVQEEVEAQFESLTDGERAVKILEKVLPCIIADVGMLIHKPFRFIWDPTVETACTDCLAEIRVAPWPFIEGRPNVGFGTVYHESGHILWSPYGGKLLTRASKEGGEVLQHLLNLIIDRKDDILTAGHAPGFADTLWRRLAYIATMSRRKEHAKRLEGMTEEQKTRFLGNWKPQDVYEDFFFACKWHKYPRYKKTRRAMRVIRSRRLLHAKPEQLLWMAKRVREILGEPAKSKEDGPKGVEQVLIVLSQIANQVHLHGLGSKIDQVLVHAMQKVLANYVAANRKSAMSQLMSMLKAVSSGFSHPGPLSSGKSDHEVPVKKMPPLSEHAAANAELLQSVKPLVEPLVKRLKRVDNPSEFELYGQDEGELDTNEAARIATGLPGYRMETVTERDIEAEIHLAVDCSGSMEGEKLYHAKQIAKLFGEAITVMNPAVTGRAWGFSSRAIYDFGPPDVNSALVKMEGEDGNSDTYMLRHVGTTLAKSLKRRKVLIVLCDDGPDDMEEARRLTQVLMARGIIVVHLLVGVHGTPDIYPVEVLFSNMQECLDEFGDILEKIIANVR